MENSVEDSKKTTNQEAESGKGMAVLAYIIALIPYFAEKKNQFVRYHAVQGMNILIVSAGFGILSVIINRIVWAVTCPDALSCLGNVLGGGGLGAVGLVNLLLGLVWAGIGILSIVGIVNAAQGKEKEVPILGKVKIIKK